MSEDVIAATIALDLPVGAGSGLGLSSCPSCGIIIDGSCSRCDAPAPSAPMSREEALTRREEIAAQHRRERLQYERGRR